jgi:large-conductance mechanosensitive channel
MNIFDIALGIAIGAAFSKFWLAVWAFIKTKLPFKIGE